MKYPAIVGLITINAVGAGVATEVPALKIMGEHDGGKLLLPQRRFPSEQQLVFITRDGSHTTLVAREGDHSIRCCPRIADDKDVCSRTPETRAMNFAVAAAVQDFVQQVCRSQVF